MTKSMSRRDFLKLASASAATTAALTGCGPASRYVRREPYTKMPEYSYNGLSTYYATTCRECSAGCGLVVRTMQGRALKVEGNKNNPVNLGKTCARGQVTLQGLYNPDRVQNPGKHTRGAKVFDASKGSGFQGIEWTDAVNIVADALGGSRGGETAFIVGLAPDHVFDLLSEVAKGIGSAAPTRFGALGMFEARSTLIAAAQRIFGQAGLPFFDIGAADVVFSFGANFLETWLSPVAQTREFARFRQGNPDRRGHFVQFEARMSQTGSKADEWVAVRPGAEPHVVQAIGRIVAEKRGLPLPPAFANADVGAAATSAGIDSKTLERLGGRLAAGARPLAVPGGAAIGQSNGTALAEAVLALNVLLQNVGKDGGVSLSPIAPLADEYHRPATMKEMASLIDRMRSGAIKTLFVHGVNPAFELPQSMGFEEAAAGVEQMISFASFPDETALLADYVLPDNHPLESWGYQQVATGTTAAVLSGAQPVVMPFVNSKSTVDVVLAAVQQVGGDLATGIPYKDEVEFLQHKMEPLLTNGNGFFTAPDIDTFAASFQQYGGWWNNADARVAPSATDALNQNLQPAPAEYDGEGEFFLVPFVSPVLGEAGANKPWLQEVPDPTTTVTWNTWIEMNPATAERLGIDDQDVVRVVSPVGTVEATVYKYPAIREDTIAMPFGQGHTAYGQFAQGRGANPLDLIGGRLNEAGDLAFGSTKVRVEKTGRKKPLARFESALGVYGFNAK
jgi:anaerobic selenocysteine-containing dehydrogenase